MSDRMRFRRRSGDLLALGASVLAIAYGAWLVVIGPTVGVSSPDGAPATLSLPSAAGLVPIGIGLVAAWAALRHSTRGLWSAAGLAVTCSIAFLFSYSLQLALLAAVLLLAATLSTRSAHKAASADSPPLATRPHP